MPPVSKKRKSTASQTEDLGDDIFAHFAAHNPGMDTGQSRTPAPKSNDDASAELLERIARLEGQNTALMELANRAPAYVAPHSGGSPTQVDPAKLKIDLTGLPDAVDKPAEFAQELQTRMNAALEARTLALRTEFEGRSNQSSAADKLWANFAEAYPDHAAHRDRVEFIATKVAEEANARGLDLQRYMYGGKQFIDDVAKRMDETFGPIGGSGDDDGDDDDTPARGMQRHGAPMQRSRDDDDDDGRTAGIHGGMESGGAPSGRGAAPKAGDMVKDLQDIQKRSGFF